MNRVASYELEFYKPGNVSSSEVASLILIYQVKEIEHFCQLHTEDTLFLEETLNKLGLSIRAWHKILRVSRTIADLENEQKIQRNHLIEALSFRAMDRLMIHLQNS